MEKLQGKRIVITRSMEDYPSTAETIRNLGGIPVACPMIQLDFPEDRTPLDRSIHTLSQFDWVFFTSSHAVHFFMKRFQSLIPNWIPECFPHTAAVGPATAEAIKSYRIMPKFVAEKSTGEDMFMEFQRQFPIRNQRFLLPLSNLARETLGDLLRREGGDVLQVTAYCNATATQFPEPFIELYRHRQIDWVLFFSPSAAVGFDLLLRSNAVSAPHDFSSKIRIASIGPSTSKALRELGIEIAVEASPHTLEGMLNEILQYEKKTASND